jgi:hypothetical protein
MSVGRIYPSPKTPDVSERREVIKNTLHDNKEKSIGGTKRNQMLSKHAMVTIMLSLTKN